MFIIIKFLIILFIIINFLIILFIIIKILIIIYFIKMKFLIILFIIINVFIISRCQCLRGASCQTGALRRETCLTSDSLGGREGGGGGFETFK